MKKEQTTYEQALQRLEEIVAGFENNETNLEELGSRLKEAQELLAFCKEKLMKAEDDIKKALDHGQR